MPTSWPPPGYGGGYQDINDTIYADIVNSIIVYIEGISSAYDVWLAEDNAGSEAAFLASLQGDDGDPGDPGQDGIDGVGLVIINSGEDANALPPTTPDGAIVLRRPAAV